ncbi:MAG: acyl-CoA dehydrogenase family protein [Pseudomonadota bacterium]
MSYRAPIAEMEFCADLVGQASLAETDRFAEAGAETRALILDEAARMAEDILVPLDLAGDRTPARLENGVVRTSPGYADGFRAIAEGGWIGLAADPENGGMGLPQSLAVMVNEMLACSCLSLSLCPLMSQGQIEALEAHAAPDLARRLVPPLVEGRWTGTMNLSEPQAGSDVGALSTKAEDKGDGTFTITGQKIWISWGDHDMAENIVHLVLARLPGAPVGTKGISLFAVPKYLPDGDGNPGTRNAVRTISLEEKLGLHGSPTCVLAYEGATGWLVGPEQGGMAAMFTMMNNARLGVGIEGLAVAEAATQKALAYAAERKQGRTSDGTPTISGHPDVRRMLLTMVARTRAARAICYDCALSIDLARAAGSEEARARHNARAAVLTPIAKAYGTQTGIEVADIGIQVHGGVGYVEDTGAAQLWRDVRVTAIYEGTNGIQAMDLVGRKLSLDGGAAVLGLIGEVGETAEALARAGEGDWVEALTAARTTAEAATQWMLAQGEMADRFAGAAAYLRMMALVLGAHHLARAALRDATRRPVAAFFVGQLLPQVQGEAAAAMAGSGALYDWDPAGAA